MKLTTEQRVEMIKKAIMCEKPERVPVVNKAEPSYAIQYAGYDMKKALWSPEMIVDAYDKLYTDVYVDATGGLPRFPLFYKTTGSRAFVPREQDDFVQHPEVEGLQADEYDEYIADPFKCIVNKIVPRIYPKLAKEGAEGSLNYLRAMIADNQIKAKYMAGTIAVEKKHNLVSIRRGAVEAPFDFVADLLRGFTGISMDVRRNPNKVKEAVEATLPIMYKVAKLVNPVPSITNSLFIPLHMPSYMRTKDFENLYWPTFKRLVVDLINDGYTLQIFFEKNWTRYYEFLQELPKGVIAYFEEDDMGVVKEKIGKQMCIMGNFPITMLRLNTKQECIDKAKEIIDKAAPGGGYMFCMDKSILSLSDAKPENLIAVSEFVHEYGVYK
ncbi:uroporphyrinogen decarboxylase (URO-D) [Oxobacter pfennigii]|uniref:Uroporphyrinogen decarboxylase (URO-D) n=1 Tax=Oxobacter pfennigii TaxID=36849 RepID=A0A0P8W4S4_9CLOT|nr:uroporphyrinogen decarboxylase family protein [Oxobacter pfennigii]KPU42514.1 uroporphyrinogen decarboxylase (URO-D) [Oxobacter pfennigii]